MFTTVLRIGPFVIFEGIFLILALIIYLLQALPQCYLYTLVEFALMFFLVEMYASLRIIKNSSKLRKEYIKERVDENKPIFYARLIWDNINIILVIMLLYSSLLTDGLQLSYNSKSQSPTEADNGVNQCSFTLFSLCLFSQLLKGCSFNSEDYMIVWMLYAATAFLISMMCIILSKEYYQYCSSLHNNRRYSQQHGGMSQALLDANTYTVNQTIKVSQEISQNLGECSICLHRLLEKKVLMSRIKIIKLKCNHYFHEECIQKWLKVKDHCPYRCFLDQ